MAQKFKFMECIQAEINTNFYKNSRDYVSKEKQAAFMLASDLAEVIYENIFSDKKLIVEDLIINRIK